MNKQAILFIGLVVIAGFIFYKTGGSDEEVNPLKNRPETETTDEEFGGTPGDIAEEEIPTEANGKNDKIDAVVEKTEDVMEKELEEITKEESSGPVVQNIEGQTFTTYSNRAMGYNIQKPDNWYWQHTFSPELENELEIIDIVIIDRSPLSENISDSYESSIVIDVIKQSPPVPNGSMSSLKISDKNAKRYESSTSLSYLIEVGNGNTIRLLYKADELDEKEKAIFEHIVQSFSFN